MFKSYFHRLIIKVINILTLLLNIYDVKYIDFYMTLP